MYVLRVMWRSSVRQSLHLELKEKLSQETAFRVKLPTVVQV